MCLSIWYSDQGLLLFFKFLSCFWMGWGGSSDLQFQARDKRRKEIHKNSQISALGDDLVLKPNQSNCTRNKPCPLAKWTSVPQTAIENHERHSPGKLSGRLKCTELVSNSAEFGSQTPGQGWGWGVPRAGTVSPLCFVSPVLSRILRSSVVLPTLPFKNSANHRFC